MSSQSDRLAGRLGGAWILDDLQMQLQPTGLGLEDLQKAGWQEAMPVFKDLKLTAVQWLSALKVLGIEVWRICCELMFPVFGKPV